MEARALEAEAQISRSSSKDEALSHAISATELYMKAIRLASNPSERELLKKKCMKVLAKAEELKQLSQWPPLETSQRSSISEQELSVPQSNRTLSSGEELILTEGSNLNGANFLPWKASPSAVVFASNGSEDLFTDVSEIHLSQTQKTALAGWKRPHEALSENRLAQDLSQPTMFAANDIDLVQDVTTDCSVVASLCAAIARPGNEIGKLLKSIMYPYDASRGSPVISLNGKYMFRLHFNGCYREVVIDDRIPTSSTSRTLHVVDRQNPGLLWPALLEKAYLKVRGGYDFPGSNSGTDLWVLTGWIPEQVFLQSDELQSLDLWNRAYRSFGYGDVMITLGTGKLTPQEEEELGLAGEHDYAVLDLKLVGKQRLLLVKNPWCDGAIWRGPVPPVMANARLSSPWASELHDALPDGPTTSLGTFWITFDEVIKNFDSLYLNWNPGLFRHRQDHHFSWNIPKSTSSTSFLQNPQFSISSASSGSVWMVLSRHFSTEEHNLQAGSVKSRFSGSSPLGYISLYVFDINGKRTYLSDNALLRGPYVDSPQTLAKLEMPASSCYTVVVAQQGLPLPRYSFTLSVYSRDPLSIVPAVNPYSHCKILEGVWNFRTAGGNAGSATYPWNPQFKISIPSTTDVNLHLESDSPELAVHVKMVWTGGVRVTTVSTKDIVGESGEYRRGCAVARISNISSGAYTIVCSTFESGQTGKFKLRVDSMVPCEVRPLASEDAGLLNIRLPFALFASGNDRVLTPLVVSSITRLTVVARHANTSTAQGRTVARSPLKLTLERGQGPHKAIIAASGDGNFSDSAAGVRIQQVDLGPESGQAGGVWLVLERFGDRESLEQVAVDIFSERSLTFGPWGIGEG